MRRALLLPIALAAASCSGTGDDPPPPPPVPCLFTDTPAAASFEVEMAGPGEARCTVMRIDLNDSETELFLRPCTGITTTATIAIAAVPALALDIAVGDVLDVDFAEEGPRRLALRQGGAIVVAASTGPALPPAAFFAPLAFTAKPGGCEPVPQTCSGGSFLSERQILDIDGVGEPMSVPTRHAFDDGRRHVRVEQADRFLESTCADLGGGWYDFAVAIDRP